MQAEILIFWASLNHYLVKFDDLTWTGIGAGPAGIAFNGSIYTLLFGSQGNLYVGGNFKDGDDHQYVAKYDPTTKQWSRFVNEPESVHFNKAINTLLVDPDGNLYAAGDFFDASKNDERYVAKKSITHSGDKWGNIGSAGSNGAIESMAMDREKNLYADMDRVDASGEHHYIGKYSTGTGRWDNIGPAKGTPLELDDHIYALAIGTDDNLYVAGDFTDEEESQFVAKYDTKNKRWSDIGFGPEDESFNHIIYTLVADSTGNLYAAGDFTDDFDDDRYVARHNTDGWSNIGVGPLDSPFNGIILSMAIGHRLFINEEGKGIIHKY